MKNVLFLALVLILFYQCKVEELPPLEPYYFLPDGVDVVKIDSIVNYPKGQSTQYILFYFKTDYSELSAEEFELIDRIVVFRDSVTIKNIPLNSKTFFGAREYTVGDKHTFSFGLRGINGVTRPKPGTEVTFTVD